MLNLIISCDDPTERLLYGEPDPWLQLFQCNHFLQGPPPPPPPPGVDPTTWNPPPMPSLPHTHDEDPPDPPQPPDPPDPPDTSGNGNGNGNSGGPPPLPPPPPPPPPGVDPTTFYDDNPGLLNLHNQTPEERQQTLENAGLAPTDYERQFQTWRGDSDTSPSAESESDGGGSDPSLPPTPPPLPPPPPPGVDPDTFYAENPGLRSLHNQTPEERRQTLQNAGLDPNDYERQYQAWRSGFLEASSRLARAERDGNLGSVASDLVNGAVQSGNLSLLRWLADHSSFQRVTFTYTDADGVAREATAREYVNAVAIPTVRAATYTGGDVTAQNAVSAWSSHQGQRKTALATLADPNATPEQKQAAVTTLNNLADAYADSGLNLNVDHDSNADTPPEAVPASQWLRSVAATAYLEGPITAETAESAWNGNLDSVKGALDTLNDPDATPEELREASKTLNGLADAFDGSGFERAWDHDNDEATPDQPITAAEQLRKWAGYASERAGSIYTDGDITPENAPAAWNGNLDTVKGALATLNDPDATPEELREAAATLNGLADAFDGSGFERAWDHDDDKDTPDQPITAAEQLRKWAGYAGDRSGSIYTDGGDITPENAASAWNGNLDTIKGALDVLGDPDATPEELREASKTLNGLAVDFAGSGFERPFDDDNDQGSPDRMLPAAEVLGRWATYARERAGPLPPELDLSTATGPEGGGRTVEFRVGIDGLPFGLWDPGTVVTPEMAEEMGRPGLAGMVLTYRGDPGGGSITTVRFEGQTTSTTPTSTMPNINYALANDETIAGIELFGVLTPEQAEALGDPDAAGSRVMDIKKQGDSFVLTLESTSPVEPGIPTDRSAPPPGHVAVPNADGTTSDVPAGSPLAFLVSPEGAQWFQDNPGATVIPKEVVEDWTAQQANGAAGAAPTVFTDSEGNPLTAAEAAEQHGLLAPGQSMAEYAAANGLTIAAGFTPFAAATGVAGGAAGSPYGNLQDAQAQTDTAQENYNQASAALNATETDDSYGEPEFRAMYGAKEALQDAELDQAIAEGQYADYQRGDGLSTEEDKAVEEKRKVERRRERSDNEDVSGDSDREYTVHDDGTVSYTQNGKNYTVSDDDLTDGVLEAARTGDGSGLSSVGQVTVFDSSGNVVAANFATTPSDSSGSQGKESLNAQVQRFTDALAPENLPADPLERAAYLEEVRLDMEAVGAAWETTDLQGQGYVNAAGQPITPSEFFFNWANGVGTTAQENLAIGEKNARNSQALADFKSDVTDQYLGPDEYTQLAAEWAARPENASLQIPVYGGTDGDELLGYQTPSEYFSQMSTDPTVIANEAIFEEQRRTLPGESGTIGDQVNIDPVTGALQVSPGVVAIVQAKQDERERQERILPGESGTIGDQVNIDPVTGTVQVSPGVVAIVQAKQDERERQERILPGESGTIGDQVNIDPVTGTVQVSPGVVAIVQAKQDERERQERILPGESGTIGDQVNIDPVTGAVQVSPGVVAIVQAKQDERERQERILPGESGTIGNQVNIDPVTGTLQVSQGVVHAVQADQDERERQPQEGDLDLISGDLGQPLDLDTLDRLKDSIYSNITAIGKTTEEGGVAYDPANLDAQQTRLDRINNGDVFTIDDVKAANPGISDEDAKERVVYEAVLDIFAGNHFDSIGSIELYNELTRRGFNPVDAARYSKQANDDGLTTISDLVALGGAVVGGYAGSYFAPRLVPVISRFINPRLTTGILRGGVEEVGEESGELIADVIHTAVTGGNPLAILLDPSTYAYAGGSILFSSIAEADAPRVRPRPDAVPNGAVGNGAVYSLGGNVDPTVAAEGNRLLDRRAASRQELDKYLNAPPPEGVDLNTWNLRGQALARDVTKADADLTDFRLRNPNLVVGYKSGGTLTATTATNLIAVVPPDGNIRIYTLPPGEAIFVPSSTETPDAVLPDGRPNTDPNDAGSADNVGPVHSSSLPVVNPAPVAPAIPATTPETATPSTTPEVTPSPAPDAAPAPSPAPTPVVVPAPTLAPIPAPASVVVPAPTLAPIPTATFVAPLPQGAAVPSPQQQAAPTQTSPQPASPGGRAAPPTVVPPGTPTPGAPTPKFPAPAPAPAPSPAPAPPTTQPSQPTPSPQVTPTPNPDPAGPGSWPEPGPQPGPSPRPVPQPGPGPGLVPQPQPGPVPQLTVTPQPGRVLEPQSGPEPEPQPQPDPQTQPQPATDPTTPQITPTPTPEEKPTPRRRRRGDDKTPRRREIPNPVADDPNLHPNEVQFVDHNRHTVNLVTGEHTIEPLDDEQLRTIQVTGFGPRNPQGQVHLAGSVQLEVERQHIVAESADRRKNAGDPIDYRDINFLPGQGPSRPSAQDLSGIQLQQSPGQLEKRDINFLPGQGPARPSARDLSRIQLPDQRNSGSAQQLEKRDINFVDREPGRSGSARKSKSSGRGGNSTGGNSGDRSKINYRPGQGPAPSRNRRSANNQAAGLMNGGGAAGRRGGGGRPRRDEEEDERGYRRPVIQVVLEG